MRSSLLLLAGLLGAAIAAPHKRSAQERTSPKTMWERKTRSTQEEAASGTGSIPSLLNLDPSQALENINKMVTGKVGFGDIMKSLTSEALNNPEPGALAADNINKLFETFGFMQQSPAYKDVADKWETLGEAAKIETFQKSLEQMTNMVVGMSDAMKNNKDKHTLDDMVVSLMNNDDPEMATLKANLEAGVDPLATAEKIQQKFVDANFPGIDISLLKDDKMIADKQAWFEQDPDLIDLIGDSVTSDMLLDPGLRFEEFAKAGMAAVQNERI